MLLLFRYDDHHVRAQCTPCTPPVIINTGGGGTSFVAGDIQAYNDNLNPEFSILAPQSPAGTSTGQAISQGSGWCEQQKSGKTLLQVGSKDWYIITAMTTSPL